MKLNLWGALFLAALFVSSISVEAATFYVNLGTDTPDANLSDGRCDTNLSSSGDQCTFRAAIQQANALAGGDHIFFDLPTGITPVLPVLLLTSPLPAVTDSVVIDASTQPIFSRVEVRGVLAGAGANGLTIQSNNCVVRNLTINSYASSGIVINGGGNHTILGNYIGLNSGGSTPRPNGVDGLVINSSSGNVIGGLVAADGNVISGNSRHGILIQRLNAQSPIPENNQILGNLIGIAPNGMTMIANGGNGIAIDRASTTQIGLTALAARNVISGNTGSGIFITGNAADTNGTAIVNNFVGADAAGITPLGNGLYGIHVEGAGNVQIGDAATSPGLSPGNLIAGNDIGIMLSAVNGLVHIQGNSIGAATGNAAALSNLNDGVRVGGASSFVFIGGTGDQFGNVIAHNGGAGVRIDSPAKGIVLLRNAIFSNEGLGIDLEGDGVTPNDADDSDTGANDLQNYPDLIIAGTRAGKLRVDGTLVSHPDTDFRLEFFANTECDPVGFGEGERFLGMATVRTKEDGETVFSAYLPQPDVPGARITATATTLDCGTSEFAECVEIVEFDLEGLVTH